MTNKMDRKSGEPLPGDADKRGYVKDFVSGLPVKATPEELEAVQVFARRLVEDYGYPKSHIQTHPQHRVRMRPSDDEKSYPVDIAVFDSPRRSEGGLFMIVECKKRNRKEGVAQLLLYLQMSSAQVGVWFNGDEHEYIRIVRSANGAVKLQTLPNIPRFGQRIEDIGLFRRRDLVKPSNLKSVFRDIRNHLAGMTTGITRDEALAQEIINILFCKILDEQETDSEQAVTFRATVGEKPESVKQRILELFERVKTATFDDVFDKSDTVELDSESMCYVVGELQNYCIIDADRDAVGDAFEVFIGPALRGTEGQFFTPRNVVALMVQMLDPKPGERIIDPACGSGGFLIGALDHVWGHLKEMSKRKGWTDKLLFKREIEIATECFRGVDKDAFLAKVCKAYMALVGDGRGGVFCANSLSNPVEWCAPMRQKIKLRTYNVVLTNPPFGNKIVVKGAAILSQFELAHRWIRDKTTGSFVKTTSLHENQPPQLLFLERCLQLLEPGGRLGIVLPESMLGNPSYEHVIAFILRTCRIIAVVTMPESLFKTSGKGGTHTKVCALLLQKELSTAPYDIFMAEAKWCGHDSRGNPTLRKNAAGEMVLLDDIPTITHRFKVLSGAHTAPRDHLGFMLRSDRIRNRCLVPKYYNPEIEEELERLRSSHDLIAIGELINQGDIAIDSGIEIGKMAYGTGPIAFIRTSDLSNWEIKADFKHGVSQEIYDELRQKVDVLPGDILLVRDGTYLIGTTAMVTPSDVPMLYQSHILRIRVSQGSRVDPWLLLACLSSPIVKRQVRAKQFTQDIIDTIGKRLAEVVIAVPKDGALRDRIRSETRDIVETRERLRNRAKRLALDVEGIREFREIEDSEAL